MDNFKKHNKGSRGTSIDGFAPRKSAVRSKFTTSYKPSDFAKKTSSEELVARTRPNSFSESSKSSVSGFTKPSTSNNARKRFGKASKKPKRIKKPAGSFKKIARGFAVLLVATLVGVSSLFAYGYVKTRNIFKGDGEGALALQQNVDPAKLNGEGDGRVNILLIGKGGVGHEAPDLTDSLLLASIDPVQNEAALVSVPRDLYVRDKNGFSTKINAVYSNAKQARLANGDSRADVQAAEDTGLDAIKDSISEVLGIPVHYYLMVDFKSFERAIDTVGGITVDVKQPLYDQSLAWLLGGNPLVADEGLQTFDGERALLYARSRKGSARGDFDRTERQREIIVALQQKVLSLGTFTNPFKVVELLDTFGDGVRTDLNGLDEIKRLYEIGQNIDASRIASVGLADPPNILVRTDNIGGLSVVVPSEGLYQYDEIHSYIRNNLRDAFLKSEDARVVILNGTNVAGLAGATSKELKSYGYNVVSVDNAPTSDYVNNMLISLNSDDNPYTKSYIERRLGLQSTEQTIEGIPTAEEADFVIILGTDEVTKTTN